ncbi:heme exporter protein CcmD [uncultured Sneathiella sp.]|uniref:heme exporter protein CcmD n=1 Tax=uncultured Sneathiella sp. TaxID=879315 RepID=UPI0030DA956E
MEQVTNFFDMGGYGLFVWPCFVLSAIVLLALYLLSFRKLKAVERELAVAESNRSEKRGHASAVRESKP